MTTSKQAVQLQRRSGPAWIVTPDEFERFHGRLLSSNRRPMIVASIKENEVLPRFDIEYLAGQLGTSVEYAVLTPAATYTLTDSISRSLTVHSGWVRVYPADPTWLRDETLAKRFADNPAQPAAVHQRIINHCLDVLFRDSRYEKSYTEPVGRPARVVVEGIPTAQQAIVRLVNDNRTTAKLNTSQIIAGVAADRVLQEGQELDGRLVPGGILGTFTPDVTFDDLTARVNDYVGDGVVTLAKATKVTPKRARLLIHPRWEVALEGSEDQRPEDLIEVGDVVAIEIVPVDRELVVSLTDRKTTRAMPILAGGPPWLAPPEPQFDDTSFAAGARTGTAVAVGAASTGAGADDGADHSAALIDELEERIKYLEGERRRLKRELAAQSRLAVPVVHSDPEKQLRLEIELQWLTSVAEADRDGRHALLDYELGPDFLKTLEAHVRDGAIERDRVITVVTECLTNQVRSKPVRAVKPWPVSAGGPQQVRSDGAAAWRVRLQSGTPSARRLKFWIRPDTSIELDSVRLHDDYA